MKRVIFMAWLDYKGHSSAFNMEEFIALKLAYPFVSMVFYCVLASYAYNTTDVKEWVVGNTFLLCTNICIFSLGGGFLGERYYGRIRSIIVSPISKMEIVLEKGFFPCLLCVITTVIGFGAGCLLFNVEVDTMQILMIFLTLVVAMSSAVGFGLVLSAVGLVTDQMQMILNIASYILLLFSGANFPVSQLPKWSQWVSKMVPLTKSIEVARRILDNNYDVGELLIKEILLACFFVIIAIAVIKVAEKSAIKNANIEMF